MERLFFRESIKEAMASPDYGVMTDRQKFAVGVVGIGGGAGATFTAMSLAFRLAEMTSGVTFAEGRCHGHEALSPYRLLAVDKTFREKDKRRAQTDGLNIYRKVNWQLFTPERGLDDPGTAKAECSVRNLPGRIIIADNPVKLSDMDLITAVVDPFPPRISAGLEIYKKIRDMAGRESTSHRRVIWLLNKSDNAAERRETERFLKLRFDIEQETVPRKVIYEAAFSCVPSYFLCEKAVLAGINTLAEEIMKSI